MITKVKYIVSEDPVRQVWKLLHFYLDTKYVADQIREVHGVKDIKHKKNIEKQAREIGYSIRQAEEYFIASSHVRLATRPVLLYYGAVSLTRALILLRKNGEVSAEALRKNNNHKHHGLVLSKPVKCTTAEEFFGSIKAKFYCHPKTKEPWGHFALFYDSLVPCATTISKQIIDVGRNHLLSSKYPLSCGTLRELSSLKEDDFIMLNLLKCLPDMYYLMQEVNILPDLCKGGVNLIVKNNYDENNKLKTIKEEFNFSIDGVLKEQKSHILNYWNKLNPDLEVVSDKGLYMLIRLSKVYDTNSTAIEKIYIPDLSEDIDGYKFYYTKPENYLPEPAIHLILLYELGMLARYSPDLWMSTVDEYVRVSELTDSFLNIVYRKFPNLILDQLTWTKHTLRN